MKRTYNPFVDNGLYVLSYYLKKDIEDIIYEDIEKSIDLMSQKIKEFVECEKYKNLKDMCFTNSVLTQPKSKVTLNEKLEEFLNFKDEECCSLCGNYNAKVKNDIGRSYIPNLTAHTFYNFSNNLQGTNICPYCLILTMYSILNCRVNKNVYLLNSVSNDFMEDYTIELQEENIKDIAREAPKEEKHILTTEIIKNLISKNKVYDDYIEQYSFNNSGQSQNIEINGVDSENIKLMIELNNHSLLEEFNHLGLVYSMLKGSFEQLYLYKIYDFDKRKLKCSEKLFDFLNKEVNVLENQRIDLIKSICLKIKESKIDKEKLYKKLIGVKTIIDFQDWLTELQVAYNEDKKEGLLNIDDYIKLDDRRYFRTIKNLMLIGLTE